MPVSLNIQMKKGRLRWTGKRAFFALLLFACLGLNYSNCYAATVQEAVNFAQSKLGWTDWSGWCLRFVGNAYGRPTGEHASAIVAWHSNDGKHGDRVIGATPASVPKGALVFFAPTTANVYGHVGLCIGNGQMIHAWISRVQQNDITYGGTFLGWRWPNSWTTDRPVTGGHASLSQLSVPSTVTIDQDFNISFTLKEIQGASKTFQNVAVAILRADGSTQFDFAMYSNVTVPANGEWGQTATNRVKSIYAPPGTYRAMVRGKLNDKWFDFDTTGSGKNDKSFSVIAQSSDTTKPTINSFSINTTSVSLGNSFSISYNVSDSGGSGLKQVELWFANDNSGTPAGFSHVKTNLHSGNGPVSGSFTYSPSSSGTYWFGLHAVDNSGNWRPESSPIKVTVVPPPTYTLSVNSSGVSWISISSPTSSTYAGTTNYSKTGIVANTNITLTAPSTSGSGNFGSWSGCNSSSGTSCTVTMSASKTVTANYTIPTYTLSVGSSGVSGVVISSPTSSTYAGTTNYSKTGIVANTNITLTAPSTSGSGNFSSWSGCNSTSGTSCSVTMTGAKTVTANYNTPTYTLTANSAGATGVAITSSPTTYSGTTNYSKTGIPSGTSLTLTAPLTSGGANFSSWTGCNSTSGTSCSVTMTGAKTVTANYTTTTNTKSFPWHLFLPAILPPQHN